MKQSILLALTAAFGLIALTTHAATITLTPYSSTSDWPSSPALNTVNAFSVNNAQSGMHGGITLEQSFTLNSALTVGTIDLAIQNYVPTNAYSIQFYQMGGSGANSTSLADWQISNASFTGTQVGSTLDSSTFTGGPSADVTGNNVLSINLAPSEQISLAAGQYFIAFIDTANAPSTSPTFYWKLSNNSSTDYYPDGRFNDGTGMKSQASYRDYGLALEVAAPVPEPASSALLALGGGLGILFLRRRSKATR